MSEYTATLREFFAQYQDGTLNTRDLIETGRTKLFDFDYPIYDEEYKKVFETNFIRKFFMREIGFETFGYFKFQLETWLLINMPYWNKMFESELLQFDPLTNSRMDVSYTKTGNKSQNDESTSTGNKSSNLDATKTGSSTGTTSGTSDSNTQQSHDETGNTTNTGSKTEDTTMNEDDFQRDLESDNPDSRLQLTANDGEGVIEYASKIKEQNVNNNKTQSSNGTSTNDTTSNVSSNDNVNTSQRSDATSEQTTNETDNATVNENDARNTALKSTINDVEDYIQHRIGKVGVQTYPKMIQEYREALLRIEQSIFNEMNELFMLVY